MQIIDQLTDKLNSSPKVPLSSNRIVDATEFTQLLDRLRINVPSSIRDSERTLAERERILAQADEEARRILAQAQKRAAEILASDHLVQSARREAERIIDEARMSAARSAEDADGYAEYVLNALSDTLAGAGAQVTNGLSELGLRRAERAGHMSAMHAPAAQAAPAARQNPAPRNAGAPPAEPNAPGRGAPANGPASAYPQYEAKG